MWLWIDSNPHYSPDLAPSDCHLSKKLKKGISGTHCQSEEDAVHAVEDILDSQEKDVFDNVIIIAGKRV